MSGTATGGSHRKLSLPNQDRHHCCLVGDRLIVAAADGAGSAERAEVGAEVATATAAAALKHLADRIDVDPSSVVREAAAAARVAVANAAEREGRPMRDFACMLLLAVVGSARGAAAQVGDGVIAVHADADGWAWVFWPQKGEYANVTRFLTDDGWDRYLEVAPLGGAVRELAVLTDGLEPLALHYATQSAHDPFFDGFASKLRLGGEQGCDKALSEQLACFLRSPRLAERVDDDLTLIVASRI